MRHPRLKKDWFNDQFEESELHKAQHILWGEFSEENPLIAPRSMVNKLAFYINLKTHFGHPVKEAGKVKSDFGYYLKIK